MYNFDCFIIGQGLAGTVLAHTLELQGKSVLIFDGKQNVTPSSSIAAGVINPITGMRFAKSWRIDEFLPFARKVYTDLEIKLETKFWYEKNIFRTVRLPEDKNNYHLRRTFEEYKPYCGEVSETNTENLKKYFQPDTEFIKLLNGAQLNIPLLVEKSRDVWKAQNCFISGEFDFSQLTLENDAVSYKMFSARKIIFCEGAQAIYNPFFKNVPFVLDKGEAIIIQSKKLKTHDIVKDSLSIVPQYSAEGDIKNYWVGATNAWNASDDKPTLEKKSEILQKLTPFLNFEFNVQNHVAAIRPTTKDRRPFLGASNTHNNVFIFNGLGSKGSLLAPFWAEHLVQHIYFNKKLDKLVDVKRFWVQ